MLNISKLKVANDEQGENLGFDCPICNNKGYYYELVDGKITQFPCKCKPRRDSVKHMRESGLGDMLERFTFKNFIANDDWQKEALEKARKFFKHPDGKWFVMCGNPGSGKTHFCTALAGEFLKAGKALRYMRWVDDGGRIKAAINDTPAYNNLIIPLKEAEALYIDDFLKSPRDSKTGKYRITDGDFKLAFDLLDYRYNHPELITIISTELSIVELLDIDEAVGSRIYQRSKDTCVSIVGKDKNWRLRENQND